MDREDCKDATLIGLFFGLGVAAAVAVVKVGMAALSLVLMVIG